MTLKEHIDGIRYNLKTGLYPNKAAVSQGIMLRLLEALDWPTDNPQVILTEYSVEEQRVSFAEKQRVGFALCHPPSEPIVFIEVKQVGYFERAGGQAFRERAEEQLFKYAFRREVPIAILTDGQKWRFFYPIGQGDYREPEVHEMDLTEDDSEKSAKYFERYLNYETIRTGEAVKAIEEEYRQKQKQIEGDYRQKQKVWSKLVEEADQLLLYLIADKVENLCGDRPTNGEVLDFLRSTERAIEESRKQKAYQIPLTVISPSGQRIAETTAQIPVGELIENLLDHIDISYKGYYITIGHSERLGSRFRVQLRLEIVDK